jgi:hypothetical protein
MAPGKNKKPETTKYIVRVEGDDPCFMEVDPGKRRIYVQFGATPTSSYYLEKWAHPSGSRSSTPTELRIRWTVGGSGID